MVVINPTQNFVKDNFAPWTLL